MPRHLTTFAACLAALALSAPDAGAGNGAAVDAAASVVPASLTAGGSAPVRIRVLNTGDTTWRAGEGYRLGAGPANQLAWSGFPCGGYANAISDSRVFLCRDVPPGDSYDFAFDVAAPAGAGGSLRLSLRMVRDGVEWFGAEHGFDVAVSQGCPTAPLATPSDRWRLEIWSNRAFAGEPVERRYDAGGAGGFSFDWGGGRASACTGDDDYAIRFTRRVDLPAAGSYTFVATSDDGIRLWVDGGLILDRWFDRAPATDRVTRFLPAGTHELRVDYYERGGGAVAALRWEYAPAGDTNGAEIRPDESAVPAALAAGETATVRLRVVNTGATTWTAGAGYRLGSTAANQLAWRGFPCGGYMNGPGDGRVFLCQDVPPGAAYDFVFDVTAGAGASGDVALAARMVRDGVEWFGSEQRWTIPLGGCPTAPLATPADRWKLEIWENRDFAGAPVERRYDAAGPGGFSFDWGGGGPSECAGDDGFAVRFTRRVDLPLSGDYAFVATADDGVRLWIDGQLVLDRWIDQPPTSYRVTRALGAGVHELRVDYYENGGGALAALRWQGPAVAGEGDLYGMNIDPVNPAGNPTPQQLRAIGVRWLRIEWKAGPGFGFYDAKIAEHRAAGLKVLLIVDYASVPGKPRSDAGDGEWLAYRGRFTDAVRDLAAHYGDGVDAWQIWNEPDLLFPGSGYDPGMPARHFGAMLRDAVGAIRPRSGRPIVGGGLASGDPGYLTAARDAAGGLTVDAIAVHPYGQRAPDGWPRPDWGFGDMSDLFDRYLAFGLPLWVSEIGTVDLSVQEPYLENVYRLARDSYAGRVQAVFWFCWSDGMVPPFGLLDAGGEPKPAYDRYRAVAPPW